MQRLLKIFKIFLIQILGLRLDGRAKKKILAGKGILKPAKVL